MPGTKKQTPEFHNNLGFTIIEMVVAMLIISIAVALTVPNFNKILGAYQLDISAREMASDIRDLQQAALKNQWQMSILWDTSKETYYLKITDPDYLKLHDNKPLYKKKKLHIPLVMLFSTNAPDTEEIPSLPASVDIYDTNFAMEEMIIGRNGIPKNGTIRLQDKTTGKAKYIIIDVLGRVRISDTPSS